MYRLITLLRCVVFASLAFAATAIPAQAPTSSPSPGLLSRSEAATILPDKVFYRGQSATIQGRNSAGIRLTDGKLVLVTVVDTSGYSSSIQQTYQAYLITETTLQLGDKTLPPGAYGFGFVENNQMVVMDIGANELLRAATTHDAAMTRPTPLQLIADSTANRYRLYLGRNYIAISPAAR